MTKRRYKVKRPVNPPTHPGLVFKAMVLDDNEISVSEFARRMSEIEPEVRVETLRIKLSSFINGRRELTWDFALILAEASKTEVDMWMALQSQRNKWLAEEKRMKQQQAFSGKPPNTQTG